tara:strand:- start:151 stop:1179 length:1029 start_codon:yes stop_codon:yes gene_type:complete
MSDLKIKNVHKSYGKTPVVFGVNLEVRSGEFIVFVGPSGCGKSTLLRMIAGLEEITEGEIEIDNEIVNDVISAERGVAMVFQSYALYPHMSVFDNMGFSLKNARKDKIEIEKRVKEAAKTLQIEELLSRLPKQLSGGQRQRVAIGRAIVRDPKIFLFDEPLSNLDAALRVQTRLEISKLHKQLNSTMIYVTHDQVEAMTLADKIVVINNGRIEQIGSPIDLYKNPQNKFVAEFIGSPKMNVLEITGHKKLNIKNETIPLNSHFIGIRPEHLKVSKEKLYKVSGVIKHIENLGEHLFCYLNAENTQEITAKLDPQSKISVGDKISLSWDNENSHFFDYSGKII